MRLVRQFLCVSEEISPDFTLMVPMRDRVELPTDIYLPRSNDGSKNFAPSPCILLRTPASKDDHICKAYSALSSLGYVVAIQQTRSSLDLEGKTVPYLSDGWGCQQDGYDTVQWLEESAFTNGSIGTLGVSSAGILQLLLAPSAPSALKCQYIGFAAASIYHHVAFSGGKFLKNQVEGWLASYAKHPSVINFLRSQPIYNDAWRVCDSLSAASKVNTPGFLYGGWYDTFLQGTLDAFTFRQNMGGKKAKGKQKLLIGPWTHFWPQSAKFGDFDVPENGRKAPIDISLIRWFDYYLKGIDNGIEQIPSITYYTMGPFDGTPSKGNVWKHADAWPIPSIERLLYLNENKTLSKEPLSEETKIFSYLYNPQDPVPTIGGANLFLESGPKDQRPIENRKDVLYFTSAILTEDLEITGKIKVFLHVSSDIKDYDICVRLSDVYPDGRSILITEGMISLTFAEKMQKIAPPISGQPREIEIELASTSIVFAQGHSIRLSISNSSYPRFEKNAHLKGKQNIRQDIYTGKAFPSRIVLPEVV